MKKLTALIILICMLFSLIACAKRNGGTNEDAGSDNTQNETNSPSFSEPTIAVPEYKDYGRGTVDFKDLVYSRPDIQAAIEAFDALAKDVTDNEKSVTALIDGLYSLEPVFSNIETMYALAEIRKSKDASDEFWKTEYAYICTNYPKLSQSVEGLLVACAKSEHRAAFENDYFGRSLEKYTAGGIYTDDAVALMEMEAALEAEYSSLSTATVEISYTTLGSDKVFEGTVDEVTEILREHFGDDKEKYEKALVTVNELYKYKLSDLTKPIFIDLIKIRRLIADELGYKSYSELAYDSLGYDYSPSDMTDLLKNVGQYVTPVASELEYTVFGTYFTTNVQPTADRVLLINNLYKTYLRLGGDYSDAFSYMLQHGLYDVNVKDENRFDGAFSTYLDDNSSPYLFMTSSGFIRDYTTMAHEFGHFLDGYVNYGEEDSLAVMEISSQALELLTLLKLKGSIRASDYEYLQYYTIFMYLNSVLLTQSFYSAFEHIAYELSYDEINEKSLEQTVCKAFELIYGEDIVSNATLTNVCIPHTILYPFYVESYVTSGIVSLDIFFAENSKTGAAGEGFKLYESLIYRSTADLSFAERLEIAGIDSPFESGKIKETANSIYFCIVGKSYYRPADNDINAA